MPSDPADTPLRERLVGEVGDKRLVWGFVSPRGRDRYTVTLDAEGRWHEIGEFSRDGIAWSGFFEMNLSRTGDG